MGLVLQLLSARAANHEVAGGNVGQGGQVAPEFLELADRENVLLAPAPPAFHILERDVGWHAIGQSVDRLGHRGVVGQVGPGQAQQLQQTVDFDPGRQGVVVRQAEFFLLAGKGQSLEDADPAIHPSQAAAAILKAPGDHLEVQCPSRGQVHPQQPRVEVGAEGVDVVQHQVFQLRPVGEQFSQHTVAQEVGDFVPVTHRVQAVQRFVGGVVASLAGGLGPADQGGVLAHLHLLLAFVQHLLVGFLPGEAQVADHRHQPQTDRPARRERHPGAVGEVERPVAPVRQRLVGGVAGGVDVRHRNAGDPRGFAAFGQMRLEERPVPAGQPGERMQRLDHAGALRPAAAHAGGQRHHGRLAAPQRLEAGLGVFAGDAAPGVGHVPGQHVLDHARRRQAVLRQADQAPAQVVANAFVLPAIETECFQQAGERFGRAFLGGGHGQQPLPQRLGEAGPGGVVAGGAGDAGQFGTPGVRDAARVGPQPVRHLKRVVFPGQTRLVRREQFGGGAVRIDGEIVHDRVHGERQGVPEFMAKPGHGALQELLGVGLAVRRDDEAHAAAGHAAEHPKAPEIIAEVGAGLLDQRLGEGVGGRRDDRLDRAGEVPRRLDRQAANVPGGQRRDDAVEDLQRLLPGLPLGGVAQQVLFGHHLQHRADVLGHAAVHEDQAVLQLLPGGPGDRFFTKDGVARQQTSPADAPLRVALGRGLSLDDLDARPDPAGVLPAAARSAEPFAEDRPGRDQPAFRLGEPAGERFRLPGRPHADRDQPGEQVRRHREPGSLGDVVDRADQFQPPARADQHAEDRGEILVRALEARGNQAGGDDRRLQQAKVISAKVEQFRDGTHIGGGLQVDADQAQHRFVDHPQAGFDRRLRTARRAVQREIDRDVQHPGAFRGVHAEEEDVAPAGVRQIHADGGSLAQDRVGVAGSPCQQFRPDAQRMILGRPGAKHPAVPGHAANA